MPRHSRAAAVPRLALTRAEAAEAIGVSVDFFDDHIKLELASVVRGKRRLYPIREIDRWLDESQQTIRVTRGVRSAR